MLRHLSRHLAVFLAALMGVVVGSVGPGIAQAAYDAVNADKVDGKHAVGAGASITNRKGKLVATDPLTGKLPNNIISKALNAVALNGYPHEALRSLSIPAQSAHPEGGSAMLGPGPWVPGGGAPSITVSFTVPPDHQSGAPLYMDTVFSESSADACGVAFSVAGVTGPSAGGFDNGGWVLEPGTQTFGTMLLPAGADLGFTRTFRWDGASEPGDVVSMFFLRQGDLPADTCGPVTFYGFQVRY
jgi:hypothetical protein